MGKTEFNLRRAPPGVRGDHSVRTHESLLLGGAEDDDDGGVAHGVGILGASSCHVTNQLHGDADVGAVVGSSGGDVDGIHVYRNHHRAAGDAGPPLPVTNANSHGGQVVVHHLLLAGILRQRELAVVRRAKNLHDEIPGFPGVSISPGGGGLDGFELGLYARKGSTQSLRTTRTTIETRLLTQHTSF